MSSMTPLSLEPLRPVAGDGHDSDLFARPARLQEVVLEDGREVFTREEPKKSLSERLMRVWAERGDYSVLSEERIRNPPPEQEQAKEDEDPRPAVEDVRKLQETMIHGLALARGELTTALDLLSVLSAPRNPPDVDVTTLPLPQQTLTTVPTAPPPAPSPDPAYNPLAALPLATSLDALARSARAFFAASEELVPLTAEELAALPSPAASERRPRARTRARAPDPWPAILRLHHGAGASAARTLLSLGAGKGATLAGGRGEARAARQVGVFFGAQEAREEWRRAAVARVGELLEPGARERTGRRLAVELLLDGGRRERVVWEEEVDAGEHRDGEEIEGILYARARAVFAEELFAQLTNESRTDNAIRAELQLGSRTEGDTVAMSGNGWTLRVTLATSPEPATPSNPTASTILSLLRLLFLQEYAARRASPPPPPRPLLATLGAFLGYSQRVHALRALLGRLRAKAADAGVEAVVDGADPELAGDVLRALQGAAVLGGRATLRVGKSATFTVLHSSPLPSPASTSSSSSSTAGLPPPPPTLALRIPGRAPIQLPSLRHLEGFLGEQVEGVCRAERGQAEREGGESTRSGGRVEA